MKSALDELHREFQPPPLPLADAAARAVALGLRVGDGALGLWDRALAALPTGAPGGRPALGPGHACAAWGRTRDPRAARRSTSRSPLAAPPCAPPCAAPPVQKARWALSSGRQAPTGACAARQTLPNLRAHNLPAAGAAPAVRRISLGAYARAASAANLAHLSARARSPGPPALPAPAPSSAAEQPAGAEPRHDAPGARAAGPPAAVAGPAGGAQGVDCPPAAGAAPGQAGEQAAAAAAAAASPAATGGAGLAAYLSLQDSLQAAHRVTNLCVVVRARGCPGKCSGAG